MGKILEEQRRKAMEAPDVDPVSDLKRIKESFEKNWSRTKSGYDRAVGWELKKLQEVIDHLDRKNEVHYDH